MADVIELWCYNPQVINDDLSTYHNYIDSWTVPEDMKNESRLMKFRTALRIFQVTNINNVSNNYCLDCFYTPHRNDVALVLTEVGGTTPFWMKYISEKDWDGLEVQK